VSDRATAVHSFRFRPGLCPGVALGSTA
jgi:hypothetical protein